LVDSSLLLPQAATPTAKAAIANVVVNIEGRRVVVLIRQA